MYKKSYTDEELKNAVRNSFSYAEVLRNLNLNIHGSNHGNIKKYIKELNIDISHFLGQGHNLGKHTKSPIPSRPVSEYLVKNGPSITSSELKRRIIRENLIKYECLICKLSEWLSKPISLHLDHIDGDRTNNTLENLRLLCPNCHSQTETYCRSKTALKNTEIIKKQYEKAGLANRLNLRLTKPDVKKICSICNINTINRYSKKCVYCHRKTSLKNRKIVTKIKWPSVEELIEKLKNNSFLAVSKELGVSDNAIRKHLYVYHINPSTLERIDVNKPL